VTVTKVPYDRKNSFKTIIYQFNGARENYKFKKADKGPQIEKHECHKKEL
jgi:hypothetical protein